MAVLMVKMSCIHCSFALYPLLVAFVAHCRGYARPFAFGEKVLEKPPGVPQPLRLPDGSPNPIWTIKMEYKATWGVLEDMVASGKVSWKTQSHIIFRATCYIPTLFESRT